MGLDLGDLVAEWLQDPTHHTWYMVFCFCLLILPVAIYALWYHREIRRTARGRKLMQHQGLSFPGTPGSMRGAGRLARDISSGKYGARVKRLQTRTYWFFAFWILACILAFGILLAADEMGPSPPT